jgi:O-antigen ligase
MIHQSFPFQGLFFLLIVPFIYFTVMPFMTKNNGLVILQALFAANFLYVLISYLTKPVDFLPYTGIAANPNGFGQIAAIAFISGFFTLITLSKKRRLAKILLIAAIILTLVSVIISSSRTSFLVVGIITLIMSVHFIVARRNFKPILTIIVVGLLVWFSPIKEMFLNGMVEKFSTTYNEGNFLSGRTTVWQVVAKDSSLFGNGEDYFQKFFEGAHNSIVYILGVYGIIPAIFLTAFLLFLIVFAFLHTIQSNKDTLTIFPFVIIVTFTLFSMTEAMFGLIGNGITIAFYHVVGLLFFNEEMKKRVKTVV